MKSSTTTQFNQGSLILLLPLLCLALITSGLDPRGTQHFSEDLRQWLLNFSAVFFPGLFATVASFMIPTSSRSWQVLSVSIIYSFFSIVIPEIFGPNSTSPTSMVLSSMSAALVYLPAEHSFKRDALSRILQFLRAVILAIVVYVFVFSIISALTDFIDLTFSHHFRLKMLTAVLAPIFTLMQTVGYTDLISIISPLQSSDEDLLAVSSAVIITNLISLPMIVLCRSLIASPERRLFLISLAFIILITSHTGICLSIELTVLLLFFPGTFVLLLCSSAFLCMICYFYHCDFLEGVLSLYQPNLVLEVTDYFDLSNDDAICLLYACIIPALFIISMWVFRQRYGYIFRDRRENRSLRYRLDRKSRPELVSLTLLRAIGGPANIVRLSRQGGELLVCVNDLSKVSKSSLRDICGRRLQTDRRRNILICKTGENSSVLLDRLNALMQGLKIGADSQYRSQAFGIGQFVTSRINKQSGNHYDREK